jgi:Fe-S-cluster-containing hydrogenase component 2
MSLLTNWLESLSYDLKTSENCLRKISPFSSCTICHDICEKQAIGYTKDGVQFDEKACNECSRCITSCPVLAIEGKSPERNVIDGVLFLEGESLPTENELLYLYKKGIRKINHPELDNRLETTINETNKILKELEMEPLTYNDNITVNAPKEKKVSRRDFFYNISNNSRKFALSTFTPIKWRFNHKDFNRADLFEGWSFFSVLLNLESCNLCESCFRLCPANVFQMDEDFLNIDISKCLGCSLCTDVCKNNAVSVTADIDKTNIHRYGIFKGTCKTCGSHFHSWEKDNVCYICKTSKENSILNFL